MKESVKKVLLLSLFIIVLLFFISLKIQSVSAATQSISLTLNGTNYTIENDYYRAVIPSANCIIRELYVKNSTGNWSNSLVKQNTNDYGLGFMEGTGNATGNDAIGLQENCTNIVVLENTSSRIRIEGYTNNYRGNNLSEIWTFWADKPYFQSDRSAVVTSSDVLANQFQFAEMVNDNLNETSYLTDENGNIFHTTLSGLQPIQSPNANTYPWINWQFFNDSVSLGAIYTNFYNPYGTTGEAGAIGFYEYQLDFDLGTGLLSSPAQNNYTRAVTTIYYTDNTTTNNDIANFANNHYQKASTTIRQSPLLFAASYLNNTVSQNPGLSSALVNSPYFLVRQNAQSSAVGSRKQYDTSIYAPLYRYQDQVKSSSYEFADQLVYSLNYNNGTAVYQYGNITQVATNNSNYQVSLQMNATSNDSKLFYTSNFQTWNDSDKLEIVGNVSNASTSAQVQEIYVSLLMPSWGANRYQAESAAPQSAIDPIQNDLNVSDNLWTTYNYAYDLWYTLIYFDHLETVPPLVINNLTNAQYYVTAYVQQNAAGNITYSYSTDNQTWNYFNVSNVTVTTVNPIPLGLINITNGAFYFGDDKNGSSGISQWAGWDMITFASIGNLSSTYDFRMNDPIYGQLGIGVKVNTSASNIVNVSIINNSEIRFYLYQNSSAQTLTNFSYPFDIQIYPHKGWLNDSSQFTGLHSRDTLNYTQHVLYVPVGIQKGLTNIIYPSGAVDYSSDTYDNSSSINMTAIPSIGTLNITVTNFNANDILWTESATNTTAATNHTIGNLNPNTNYNVYLDGSLWNTYTSNSSGYISFIYNSGYSTHIFEVVPYSSPAPSAYPTYLGGGGGYPSTSTLNQNQSENTTNANRSIPPTVSGNNNTWIISQIINGTETSIKKLISFPSILLASRTLYTILSQELISLSPYLLGGVIFILTLIITLVIAIKNRKIREIRKQKRKLAKEEKNKERNLKRIILKKDKILREGKK